MRIRDFVIIMGRTIPSYRMAIDIEIAKWKTFRDALRKPDCDIFENMLLRSKLYASAGGMAVRPIVLEAMFMSILLDHHKRLLELVAEIEKLKNPEGSKEPEGIEKFLQPPPLANVSTCQTTIETTLQPEDS
jgi:hypothetical protein